MVEVKAKESTVKRMEVRENMSNKEHLWQILAKKISSCRNEKRTKNVMEMEENLTFRSIFRD